MTEHPDPITVTLTREEAEVVASDIDSGQVLAFGYQVAEWIGRRLMEAA